MRRICSYIFTYRRIVCIRGLLDNRCEVTHSCSYMRAPWLCSHERYIERGVMCIFYEKLNRGYCTRTERILFAGAYEKKKRKKKNTRLRNNSKVYVDLEL